jgi:hydroxymethylpyrimidine/phosphomethylpyrimidine kinase
MFIDMNNNLKEKIWVLIMNIEESFKNKSNIRVNNDNDMIELEKKIKKIKQQAIIIKK